MQKLPASGPAREALRVKGQFWTPAWLARVMAAWVTARQPATLFDPAVGPGTFFAAAREVGFTGEFSGFELDDSVLAESYKLGLPSSHLGNVVVGDFITSHSRIKYPAIISNPPYIRHHRLRDDYKARLRHLAVDTLGFPLDGRTGLHVYFLLKCLAQLAPGGRLAFVLPADVCEGTSSSVLWSRLAAQYRMEAILTFAPEAAPFPQVDTNAMVFLISREPPSQTVTWLNVLKPNGDFILAAVGNQASRSDSSVVVHMRTLDELIRTGFSRPPRLIDAAGVCLRELAKVMRGIATGANEFFFLNQQQIRELGLDKRYFRRAIGRTRDCPGSTITQADLDRLDAAGRPTWLLNLPARPLEALPVKLKDYLQQGERMDLPQRPLIQTRRPWYRMEQRQPPALLFAYLGRRDCRFILNQAGVVPLTGFLCVYPWDENPGHLQRLYKALNHPDTLANLGYVGKSYGGGALKVEPRQLDALEIPGHVLREFNLAPKPAWQQGLLLQESGGSGSKKSGSRKGKKR